MEKENKNVKKSTTKGVSKSPAIKASSAKATAKVAKTEKVKTTAVKKPEVIAEAQAKTEKVVAEVVAKSPAKKTTLNQELNLLIGLFSLVALLSFCFAFQQGDVELLGWELVLRGKEIYSGVFQGLMILFVITIFIDTILAIRIDTDNEIINIIEKVLYMFTAIMNFVVIAILLSLISNIGTGLLIFFVISIISVVVKFVRIFSQK